MSYNIFFISDHHIDHAKPYTTFKREDGKLLRYEFKDYEEGREAMIQRHNSVVKDGDRVYFVGDFCFHKRALVHLDRMNGRKVLIKGNHDLLDLKDYMKYFDDVRGSHQFSGCLITHIPVHPSSLGKWGFNIHGHTHANVVRYEEGESDVDPRYFNVSVENINYTPISLEEVKRHKPNYE